MITCNEILNHKTAVVEPAATLLLGKDHGIVNAIIADLEKNYDYHSFFDKHEPLNIYIGALDNYSIYACKCGVFSVNHASFPIRSITNPESIEALWGLGIDVDRIKAITRIINSHYDLTYSVMWAKYVYEMNELQAGPAFEWTNKIARRTGTIRI